VDYAAQGFFKMYAWTSTHSMSEATPQDSNPKNPGSTIISIKDALKQDVYHIIRVVGQLRIAHKLAIVVLQYNETLWLPNDWRLLDIHCLGTNTSTDATTLKTLHVSSEIRNDPNAMRVDRVQLSRNTVANETRQGITNPILFCLGIALLEIAYWSPIEAKMIEEDESNPVLATRRLQNDRSIPLSPEYLSIAKRCLWCDFGFGDQLSEKGLQSVV
jgi:hypothetical protein